MSAPLRGRGVNYDTGFWPAGETSRASFEPDVVRRELHIISTDVHCNAVRITGGDPVRLSIASEHAAAAGLEVWFAPFPCDLTPAQMLPYLADCAERAEDLRQRGARVVFVAGCELSLFAAGFLPGDGFMERITAIRSTDAQLRTAFDAVPARVNAFLAEAVTTVRRRFGGQVTYASVPFERVDWTPFDVIGIDAYRSARNAPTYRQDLRHYSRQGKPVAVTEFGGCTYRGAAERGAGGWMIIDEHGTIAAAYTRDENEQAAYLGDLLEIFEAEAIDSAFWLTFAGYNLPHRPDPRHDLDMASFGLVKILDGDQCSTYPDMAWEPKQAFTTLANAYARE